MVKVCKDCGTVAEPAQVTNGSIGVELILWLCFLVPGLIYSVWRLSTRHDACRSCGSKGIVPVNSPAGARVAAQSGYVPPPPYRGSARAERVGRQIGRMFAKK